MYKNNTLSFTSGLMTNSKFLWTLKHVRITGLRILLRGHCIRPELFSWLTHFSTTGTSTKPNQMSVSICLHLVSVSVLFHPLLFATVPLLDFHNVACYFCLLVCLWMCVQRMSTCVGRCQKMCLACFIAFCLIPLRQDLPLKPEVCWRTAGLSSSPHVVESYPVLMLQICVNPC